MVKACCSDGKVLSGSYPKIAAHFGVRLKTIAKVWRQTKLKVETYRSQKPGHGALPSCLFNTGRSNCGRKPLHDREELQNATKEVNLKARRTTRGLAGGLGIPKSTLHDIQKKEKVFKTHSASLKPKLTETNQLDRLFYALDMIQSKRHGHSTRAMRYRDVFDTVHVDEKWFYLIKAGTKYILVHDEQPPKLSTYNKNSIKKVMFLCALARPKTVNGVYFDGKRGIWPIGCYKAAQRSSKRRE